MAAPPAKLSSQRDRLLRLVAEKPDLTLKQIGASLTAESIDVSESCLHTFLWRSRSRSKKRPPTPRSNIGLISKKAS